MRKTIKKGIPVVLALVMILSLSCVAFAAEATKTASRSGNTLTGALAYWAQESVGGGSGDMDVSASWSGSKVEKIYTSAEVVDYVTGYSLMSISNEASNATVVMSQALVEILNTRRVTVCGCGEIRDSFSLVVRPKITGTYGKSDWT